MTVVSRPLEGLRVLVVEDQYFVAVEMRTMLAARGAEVVGPAKDIGAAEELLRAGRVDLALLDVNLDGGRVYPLAERLRAQKVPVIFATGYESWALKPEFAEAPIVAKPVTSAALDQTLATLLPVILEARSHEGA